MKCRKNCNLFLFFLLPVMVSAQTNFAGKKLIVREPQRIVVALEMSKEFLEYCHKEEILQDSFTVEIVPVKLVGSKKEQVSIPATKGITDNALKVELNTPAPIFIRTNLFHVPMLSPGDSINIRYSNGTFHFSGKGAAKCKLYQELEASIRTSNRPSRYYIQLQNTDEYLQWLKYADTLLRQHLSILDRHKNGITEFEYDYLYSLILSETEMNKISYFMVLAGMAMKDSALRISNKDLCAIWDSTQYNPNRDWLVSQYEFYGSPHFLYYLSSLEVRRRFHFNSETDSIRSKEKRTYLYYMDSKKRYKGHMRERALAHMMDEPIITEMGLQSDMTKRILTDYYSEPGYPEYKDWVRQLEKNRLLLMSTRGTTIDFSLKDMQGRVITRDHFRGKIAFLDFWFTGCKPCMETKPYLQQIEDAFRKDTNVVMVSISTDTEKSKWLNSVASGKYTTTNALNVYTNGEGQLHPMLKFYQVEGYPEFHLLDYNGGIVQFPLPDPRTKGGVAEIIKLIRREVERKQMEEIAASSDGPYIFHEKEQRQVFQITNNQLLSQKESGRKFRELRAATDEKGKFLSIKLKDQLVTEQAEFAQPEKLFALSDIEGNFDALRKLLQNNGIIDSAYNWTFGNGHLVFAGDMFDRGTQVTECLWLLYSLEDKARSSGGYVHFILGNHEIMNLYGNNSYAREKYHTNAKVIGKTLTELYNENSELGRWLRTKNIMEKIGNMLFLHAGVSAEINRLQLSLSEINQLARPHYDDSSKNYSDPRLKVIMVSKASPFWYRGYYDGKNYGLENIIDSTLRLYQANHIVTGHTIVADTVSVRFNGKIINTDTHHAGGKSEALLLENNCFYRVNAEGIRVLLFGKEE